MLFPLSLPRAGGAVRTLILGPGKLMIILRLYLSCCPWCCPSGRHVHSTFIIHPHQHNRQSKCGAAVFGFFLVLAAAHPVLRKLQSQKSLRMRPAQPNLSLPAEVRLMIWRQVLHFYDITIQLPLDSQDPTTFFAGLSNTTLPIFLVSKSIRVETLLMRQSAITYDMKTGSNMSRIFELYPKSWYTQIRHIAIKSQFTSAFTLKMFLDRRFPHLESLTIKIYEGINYLGAFKEPLEELEMRDIRRVFQTQYQPEKTRTWCSLSTSKLLFEAQGFKVLLNARLNEMHVSRDNATTPGC